MPNRYADWLRQAEADLKHAQNATTAGDFDWACFAAQQAAEKALKAVILRLGGEPWAHSVTVLSGNVAERVTLPLGLLEAAKRLDKHYIPARYPNGFDSGAPTDFYTPDEARNAVADAQTFLDFVRGSLG